MLNGATFGFVNGVITLLSLLTGMYATHVNKIGMIGTILAMIISDPLLDAYSIYIAQQANDANVSPVTAIKDFLSQVSLQAMFLAIIIITPTVKQGLYVSYFAGFLATMYYSYYKSLSIEETIKNVMAIIILILVTLSIDTVVYKYFKSI